MLSREYAREALKSGLMLEEQFGTNPYKFGMVGATDSHTGLSTAEEDNFFGKSTSVEPSATRIEHPFISSDLATMKAMSCWLRLPGCVGDGEYARSAVRWLWSARKPTPPPARAFWCASSGLGVRRQRSRSRTPAFSGYEKGVPMGGDLTDAPAGSAPTFMVFALRDPIGANLDRIQIVKGWLDASGETQERIYDVAVSDGRKIGSDGRARTPVGNTARSGSRELDQHYRRF